MSTFVERSSLKVASLGLIAMICVAAAALLTGFAALPPPLNLRPELVVLGIVFAVCSPLLLPRWRTTFWILLVWLVLGDLFRKLLGNDIRVYFFKDALYVLLIIGIAMDRSFRGIWHAATGSVRFALYALIGWTVVLAVPLFFTDWRVPLIALLLSWEYVPLVIVSYALACRRDGVRSLLSGFVLISIPACAAGIAQSVAPGFLMPEVATPFLDLTYTRAFDVVQPSGTFASPGRFGNMALLAFAFSLALLVLTFRSSQWRYRLLALSGLIVSGVAVWVLASKTSIIIAAILTVVASTASAFAERKPATLRAVITIGLVAASLVAVFAFLPRLSENRVQYFSATLSPASESNEWDSRLSMWQDNMWRGLSIGGVLGAGTGAGSNGIQYVADSRDIAAFTGVAQIEGGFAAVAQQWGIVGLVLWLGWSVSWMARAWRSVVNARGSLVAGAGLVLIVWVVFYLFVGFVMGFQSFQDYYSNAYFWLLSGILFSLGRRARPTAAAAV